MKNIGRCSFAAAHPIVRNIVLAAVVVLTIAAETSLVNNEQHALAALVLVVAGAAVYLLVREERLLAGRLAARRQLDKLRGELGKAQNGDGADYEWVRRTPYRPAFTSLLRNGEREVRCLEVQAQTLERRMEVRRFWQSATALLAEWDSIAFRAERMACGMRDSLYWSQACGWSALSSALDADYRTGSGKAPFKVVAGGKR